MEAKNTIIVAMVSVIGGIVGGSANSAVNYFLGLESKRYEYLQEARKDTYTKWLEIRALSRKSEKLEDEGNFEGSKKVSDQFHQEGRQVMGKIATYGGKEVVESVANWYRTFPTLKHCECRSEEDEKGLMAEIATHQEMRKNLIPNEPKVSDADMAILLLQCDLPVVRKSK